MDVRPPSPTAPRIIGPRPSQVFLNGLVRAGFLRPGDTIDQLPAPSCTAKHTVKRQILAAIQRYEARPDSASLHAKAGLVTDLCAIKDRTTGYFHGKSLRIGDAVRESILQPIRAERHLPPDTEFRADLTIPTPQFTDFDTLSRAVSYNVIRLLTRPISDECRDAAHAKLDRYRARIEQYKRDTGRPSFDETISREFNESIMGNKAFLSSTANAFLGGARSGAIDTAVRAQDNLKVAYHHAYQSADAHAPMSIDLLSELNRLINDGIVSEGTGGELRKREIFAAVQELMYLPVGDLPAAMNDFVDWVNRGIAECDAVKAGDGRPRTDRDSVCFGNPLILAGKVCERLISYHPFPDGNGRTGRLAMDWVLRRCELPSYVPENTVNVAVFGRVGEYDESPEAEKSHSADYAVTWAMVGVDKCSRMLKLLPRLTVE